MLFLVNFQGQTAESIISDLKLFLIELKSKFGYRNENVTLCTIPPIPNILGAEQFLEPSMSPCLEQAEVNDWIINLSNEGYIVIPLDTVLTRDGRSIKLDLYQK